MKTHSHKQIINLVLIVVPITVVLCTLFLRPRLEVNSYEKCAAQKDSMLMLSYPAKCITKDGKTFTQPKEDMQEPERGHATPEELFPEGSYEPGLEPEPARDYEDCISYENSKIMESYPEQCMYSDGYTVTRVIDEEIDPYEDVFTCPETAWVDCMPTVTDGDEMLLMQRAECTQEFEEWAYANCPSFEGIAY